jgi:ArsR family transcriptional regulator
MKVCIPTEDQEGLKAKVYGHFGSAPFFTVVDSETLALETISNASEHHEHGACNPVGSISGRDVKAVICGGMGAGAVQKLTQAGIDVYIAEAGTVGTVVAEFKENKLRKISAQGACNGHGCSH